VALGELIPTLAVAVMAAAMSFGVTPAVARLAGILGMEDRPADRKIHSAVIPYLGGLAILSGWVVALLTPGTFAESVVLVACMGALGFIGFVDDRHDISPHLRLGLQVVLACGAFAGGLRMTPTDVYLVDFALTVVWLVGMTNAFNFMDNMDGLAAGVGGIGAVFLGTAGVLFGQKLVSLLGFALAGACFGFLKHNFHPARIFMGDAGSLPIGFGLAALAIKLEFPNVHPLVAFAVPVTILGLFVLDTTVMALGRVLRGEAVIGARLDHLSHRMLQRSLPVRAVALRLYAVAFSLGVAGLAVSRMHTPLAAAAIVMVATAFAIAVARIVRWPILVRPTVPALPETPLPIAG
jgi:UDP-GlcNAc:undecaprenyl-phosphate GlcNAc-1-phosphate transferase